MKSNLKFLLEEILFFFLRPFPTGFSNRLFPASLLMKHVIIQKVLRINSHVPWPVHWTSQIKAVEGIRRGTRCPGLSTGTYLDGRNGIIIGENTWIGPHVHIVSMNHDVSDYTKYQTDDPIIIGDNCWLGAGCTILSGVRLGNHVVVAAGAVVTKSFDIDNVILGGVPARVVKHVEPYGNDDAL
jgi:serine acetyltransferase